MVESGDGKKSSKSRKFFFPQGSARLPGGLEAWRGFYTSVRPVYKSISINVNVATTAFYKPMNLLDAFNEARNVVPPKKFTAYYFGVRVQTTYLGYRAKKSIKRVMETGADQTFFMMGEGNNMRRVSVQDYFRNSKHCYLRRYLWKLTSRTAHNITLRYPKAPVVDVGSQKRENFIPPELCEILSNQVFKGKLADGGSSLMTNCLILMQPQNTPPK